MTIDSDDSATVGYRAFFSALGADIDRAWATCDHRPSAFPTIAAAAATRVSGIEIEIDRLLLHENQHLDLSYRFSDFDVRIFQNARFRIDILVWLGGTTSIHQQYHTGPDSPIRQALLEATRTLGLEVEPKISGMSNIGNYLAGLGIPATAGFGVAHHGLHATDERIRVDTVPIVQAAYHAAVLKLLTSTAN